jgi:hypothetical protein
MTKTQEAAERLILHAETCGGCGSPYRPGGQYSLQEDEIRVGDAYLTEQDAIATIKLRCGYILGVCKNLSEAQAEARYILELLGEK